jgi:hypothetical protein
MNPILADRIKYDAETIRHYLFDARKDVNEAIHVLRVQREEIRLVGDNGSAPTDNAELWAKLDALNAAIFAVEETLPLRRR